jgi:hypothetical protein
MYSNFSVNNKSYRPFLSKNILLKIFIEDGRIRIRFFQRSDPDPDPHQNDLDPQHCLIKP